MKLLHTSDWHVGRTIRGRSRAGEHVNVLAEIVDIAERERVDLVVVAGDMFDSPAPSAEAEGIVYRALLDVADTGAEVVVLAGNHDNPRRWKAIHPLLALGNVHVAADVVAADKGGVLDLKMRSGETARIALIPFLNQRSIVRAEQLMTGRADSHAGTYAARAKAIIDHLTSGFTPDTVNLVAAHLTVAHGAPSLGGGERAAHTIFDYVVPPTAFPPSVQYVALGHLHQPHRVPAACPVWYCGSPLALDFGEAERANKAVLLVEVEPGLPAEVTEVPLTQGRALRTVRGTLDDLRSRREELADAHLRVVLTEPERVGLADEVREEFPGVVDVRVAHEDDEDAEDPEVWDLDDFHRSPADLFAEYLADVDVQDAALTGMFAELLEDVVATDPA